MTKTIIIAIVIIIIAGLGYWFYQSTLPTEEPTLKEQACINSGGIVSTSLCCKSTNDFPNLCLVDPCGCSPDNSHQIKICDCGPDKCFDGDKCTPLEVTLEIEAEIANNLWNDYLDGYKSLTINPEERVEDYIINNIEIDMIENECFGFTVDFSVKTTISPSNWMAGNGNMGENNWINNKTLFVNATKTNGSYVITEMGTGRASNSCKTDETADWETYRNKEYGFEVKYPEDWNYGPNILKETPNMVFCPPGLSDVESDLKCKWESENGHMPKSSAPVYLFVWKMENFPGEINEKGTWKNPEETYVYELTLFNNSFQDVYNQMIYTFRFIDEEIVNWKTYSNEEYGYGYSIKYPNDWTVKIKDASLRCQHEPTYDCLSYIQISPPSTLSYSWVNLAVYNNQGKYSTEKEWLDNNMPLYNSQAVSIDNDFKIGGENGIKIVSVNGCQATQIYLLKGENLFELTTCAGIGQGKTNDIFNQMLSTFKFLD